MKKSKLKASVIIAVIAIFCCIVCAGFIYMGWQQIEKYRMENADLQYEIDSNTTIAYVASRDISAGEPLYAQSNVGETLNGKVITEEDVNVHQETLLYALTDDFLMSSDMLGYAAKVDIPETELITKMLVSQIEISMDTREYEVNVANLMVDQMDYDYVDVRILFPDGSDYLILPKKQIKNLSMESGVFITTCDEYEILMMSSAIIDAYTTTGAYIYTTRYVESSLQDAAVPNYPVKPATLTLLESDPNVLKIAKETLNTEVRHNLATRLSLLTKEQLDAVADGFGIADTAKSAALSANEGADNETDSNNEDLSAYDMYDTAETEETPEE